ncbi:DUF6247 family protein [Yinghuangia sp. ASG 101]|uniref:DUF6247 family protein n=1 Tax=Yinghuangia sp. ASG 101 TaxID=2896848 RepID=UPI001E537E70|nr:DUF6247 family protein [Yinghuangia sp. ASG 101]UGQ14005.1 DUF6247 family protein [Yinghuangia sp. ASG 101]
MDARRERPAERIAHEVNGPWVYAVLAGDDREEFDRAFRAALKVATDTFDTEPVAEVVRRWWVVAGGDPRWAEEDRRQTRELATLTRRERPRPLAIYQWEHQVDKTGPAVFAALPFDRQGSFVDDFHRAAADAAVELDHRGLVKVVGDYWAVAFIAANPEEQARILEDVHRLEAGDPTLFE